MKVMMMNDNINTCNSNFKIISLTPTFTNEVNYVYSKFH